MDEKPEESLSISYNNIKDKVYFFVKLSKL